MSTFDPSILESQTFTESNSTFTIPVPIGEYQMIIDSYKLRTWSSKDGSKSGVALDIQWSVEDPNVKALLERDKVTVKQGIMLDMTDAGGLDFGKGKNVSLGRLREALNINSPGQPFSFTMLPGRMAKGKVSHRPDDRNPGQVFAEVEAVARA